jgi:hypothetical protein
VQRTSFQGLNQTTLDACLTTGWMRAVRSFRGFPGSRSKAASAATWGCGADFESEEGLRIWATHAQHVVAKKKGRELFFTEYCVQVRNVMRDSGKKLTQAGTSN